MSAAPPVAQTGLRPNRRPYTQLYNAHINDIRELLSVSPGAVNLLLVMIEHMGRRNALVASIASLVRISGTSKSTVLRALELLEKSNFIQRIAVDTAPVIIINDQVVWTDRPEFRGKMTAFDAAVITFDDEQPTSHQRRRCLKKLRRTPA